MLGELMVSITAANKTVDESPRVLNEPLWSPFVSPRSNAVSPKSKVSDGSSKTSSEGADKDSSVDDAPRARTSRWKASQPLASATVSGPSEVEGTINGDQPPRKGLDPSVRRTSRPSRQARR